MIQLSVKMDIDIISFIIKSLYQSFQNFKLIMSYNQIGMFHYS